jgi:hypothetical protein
LIFLKNDIATPLYDTQGVLIMTWSFILIFSPLCFLGVLWLIGSVLIKLDERHKSTAADDRGT